MSSGASANVTSSSNSNPSPTGSWNISLNGNKIMTVQEYYNYINSGNLPIKALSGTYDISKLVSISNECWNSNDEEVNCATLDCNQSYEIQHTASYNNEEKSVSRKLNAGC
jgi:hypothetical protein